MQTRGIFISEFERQEFLTERWDYRAGDHVTFAAPTDYGKTTLANELLEHTISPQLPAYLMEGKKTDKVMSEFIARLDLRLVTDWPPPLTQRWRFWEKPLGWVVWPPHTGNEDIDDPRHAATFKRLLRWCHNKGRLIIVADEFGEMKELGLDKTTRAIHRRGRSHGVGLWGGVQGPTHAETHAYSQAAHLFLGNTPDKRHRERFGEIGGFDPRLIEDTVLQLPDHWWLYLRRRGRVMCIVRA